MAQGLRLAREAEDVLEHGPRARAGPRTCYANVTMLNVLLNGIWPTRATGEASAVGEVAHYLHAHRRGSALPPHIILVSYR